MDYTIIEKGAFKVIGIRRITPYGGGTWAIVKSDGSNDRIFQTSGRFFDLGLCFGFQPDGSDDYMCAIEWDGEDVPGFDSFTCPAAQWIIFEDVYKRQICPWSFTIHIPTASLYSPACRGASFGRAVSITLPSLS